MRQANRITAIALALIITITQLSFVTMATPAPVFSSGWSEDFDNISTLGSDGWAIINHSAVVGSTSWFQSNYSMFPAYQGAASSYICANYNSTTGSDTSVLGTLTIKGTLLDADGNPMAGFFLELHSNLRSAVTDVNGRYVFSNVTFAHHILLVKNADGVEVATYELDFAKGDQFLSSVTQTGANITYTDDTAEIIDVMKEGWQRVKRCQPHSKPHQRHVSPSFAE